jgi:hypothetical protein
VKSSEDVDRPQAGGYNSCEARADRDYANGRQPAIRGFLHGNFLLLTSYFLQYERDISQILSLTLNASSIRPRGEREDTS